MDISQIHIILFSFSYVHIIIQMWNKWTMSWLFLIKSIDVLPMHSTDSELNFAPITFVYDSNTVNKIRKTKNTTKKWHKTHQSRKSIEFINNFQSQNTRQQQQHYNKIYYLFMLASNTYFNFIKITISAKVAKQTLNQSKYDNLFYFFFKQNYQ